MALIALGLYIPELIAWQGINEKKSKNTDNKTESKESKKIKESKKGTDLPMENTFIALVYFLAFLFSLLPWGLLRLKSDSGEFPEYCKLSTEQQ